MDARVFLSTRTPQPPRALAAALAAIGPEGPAPEALTSAGMAQLRRALACPGRVRESAFHLLAADALLTYACEAASLAPDPESELRQILRWVGSRET